MTENELNEIEARAYKLDINPDYNYDNYNGKICDGNKKVPILGARDVPRLIAEVRQLRAERDAIIKVVVKNGQANCPGTSFNCKCQNPKEKDCGDAEECWLTWARNEVEKAKEI